MSDLPKLALSILQPWTHYTVNLGENIKKRNLYTRFRGPVCIHTGQNIPIDEMHGCLATAHGLRGFNLWPRGNDLGDGQGRQPEGIIATAEIVDCVGRPGVLAFNFVLRSLQPVDFIPVKGALGFFDWRRNLEGAN
ncbi:hypothetical protein GOZ97_07635 [Agrobacterium vitis]|uniref:hypothetical protein n=1 Tax=Agrobacterium vitis TaxID=373 RepID=UPI0008FB7725|nr:hypothetical protein [Agrobacterium vitis]MUZ53071.1 hypothetical protein [Agrobacterium vitis]MUZ91290.1 hypothetical protein [Agrobacterium vitis]MVA40266.1 hypothetical protein [Agrobacterium vitis]NSX96112.1 hypothetical protein [Agrobacterium vitis]NSZ27251.1 hypothetical protein [Agrobacterium vitis]